MNERRLVNTSDLARSLGLSARTIQAYRQAGVLVPDVVSVGGHARWDTERVRQQLREMAAQRRPGREDDVVPPARQKPDDSVEQQPDQDS